tara:strand:- start:732 stop:1265 length:534 start_codon:yes stop_codon:yes gene_type:complete
MVSSLDGFIARKNGDVSWMQSTDHYEKGTTLTEEQITTFLQSVDCYVMGSRTYEHALELGWPYGNTPVIVLTNRDLPNKRGTVEFYSGTLQRLLSERLKPHFRNVWVVGGSRLTKDFLQQNLADEIVLSIMPVILGDGLPFFDHIGTERQLHLKDSTAYKDGMVELRYTVQQETSKH